MRITVGFVFMFAGAMMLHLGHWRFGRGVHAPLITHATHPYLFWAGPAIAFAIGLLNMPVFWDRSWWPWKQATPKSDETVSPTDKLQNQ